MALGNIDRVLCFAKDPQSGRVLSLDRLQERFGFEPDGTNFYYGINRQNRDRFTVDGAALNQISHRPFFDEMLAALQTSEAQEKTVVLGVEPPQQSDPFGFVAESEALVTSLAQELGQIQAAAREAGKSLNIAIRYASEMNDTSLSSGHQSNLYAGQPEKYKSSFRSVREIFRSQAPEILFAFSPAIRRDLNEPGLSSYWPGDDFVDLISCTWYIGASGQTQGAVAFMKAYALHREMKGKPFAIDELGGCETFVDNHGQEHGRNCDAVRGMMLRQLLELADEGIRFNYVTLFLEGKWGEDATRGFMANL
jgi:hypothetical protein